MTTDLSNLSIAELKKIKKDNKQKLKEEYKQKLIDDIKKIQELREKIKPKTKTKTKPKTKTFEEYFQDFIKNKTIPHAWKFLCQFWPSFVSPFPQSSSLKFCAAISPAREERKSVRLYRHVRENWY